jgi:hypothetical protein
MGIVFVDGPVVLRPVDVGGSLASTSLAGLGAEADATSTATPRAWWKMNWETRFISESGLDDSEAVPYLRDILRRDRYDVSIFTHVTPGPKINWL